MSFEDFLAEEVTLQRPSVSGRDTSGGVEITWATVATAVPVHIVSPTASQRTQYQQLKIAVPYQMFTRNEDAVNGDRVQLTDGTFVLLTGISDVLGMGTLDAYVEWNGLQVTS